MLRRPELRAAQGALRSVSTLRRRIARACSSRYRSRTLGRRSGGSMSAGFAVQRRAPACVGGARVRACSAAWSGPGQSEGAPHAHHPLALGRLHGPTGAHRRRRARGNPGGARHRRKQCPGFRCHRDQCDRRGCPERNANGTRRQLGDRSRQAPSRSARVQPSRRFPVADRPRTFPTAMLSFPREFPVRDDQSADEHAAAAPGVAALGVRKRRHRVVGTPRRRLSALRARRQSSPIGRWSPRDEALCAAR